MHTLALGFGNFGGPDLIIILAIVLVLFGAKKLPELARGLGQSMNEFRKAREELEREVHSASNDLKGSLGQIGRSNRPSQRRNHPQPNDHSTRSSNLSSGPCLSPIAAAMRIFL
jgi:sec-independent protein translocase protein TatA